MTNVSLCQCNKYLNFVDKLIWSILPEVQKKLVYAFNTSTPTIQNAVRKSITVFKYLCVEYFIIEI